MVWGVWDVQWFKICLSCGWNLIIGFGGDGSGNGGLVWWIMVVVIGFDGLGFDHGGFGAWWAAWIGENDDQHSISPLCVLWNSDRWWWLWFPSSPFTATSRHQGSLLDLSLYLFFSWTHPIGASFFDPWWCGGFRLFTGSKYVLSCGWNLIIGSGGDGSGSGGAGGHSGLVLVDMG